MRRKTHLPVRKGRQIAVPSPAHASPVAPGAVAPAFGPGSTPQRQSSFRHWHSPGILCGRLGACLLLALAAVALADLTLLDSALREEALQALPAWLAGAGAGTGRPEIPEGFNVTLLPPAKLETADAGEAGSQQVNLRGNQQEPLRSNQSLRSSQQEPLQGNQQEPIRSNQQEPLKGYQQENSQGNQQGPLQGDQPDSSPAAAPSKPRRVDAVLAGRRVWGWAGEQWAEAAAAGEADPSREEPWWRYVPRYSRVPAGQSGSAAAPEWQAQGMLFRGVPWRWEVGAWLQQWGEAQARGGRRGGGGAAEPSEGMGPKWFSQPCPSNCSGRGVCNAELGLCRCTMGFTGAACELPDPQPCNLPASHQYPFGRWIVSICPAHCDNRTAKCFCGPDSPFPHRAVRDTCVGDEGREQGKPPIQTRLFSTDPFFIGWCHADPLKDEPPGSLRLPSDECTQRHHCPYDGWAGDFCNEPTRQFCFGGCHERGECDSGYCLCQSGWYGVDCSIPTAASASAMCPEAASHPARQLREGRGGRQLGPSREMALTGLRLNGRAAGGGHSGRGLQEEAGSEAVQGGASEGGAQGAQGGAQGAEGGRAHAAGSEAEAAPADEGGELSAAGEAQQQPAQQPPLPEWLGRVCAEEERGREGKAGPAVRPLIYIYDLPAELLSHVLQGRLGAFYCVPWIYRHAPKGVNHTHFDGYWLYGMEAVLIESLLASPHRTNNAEEADYFFVPLPGACVVSRAFETLRYRSEKTFNNRPWFASDFYLRALAHIQSEYPFWNRSGGRDHIWLFPWDEGAGFAPQALWPSILVSHWGNTGTPHNRSTTAFYMDNWEVMDSDIRGNHPCFDPGKDVVMPAWKAPQVAQLQAGLWRRPLSQRPTLFYFNGNLGDAFKGGRPETKYSMGIRQRVAAFFASNPNKHGQLGSKAQEGVVVTSQKSESYAQQLASSRFCGVFPGDGFSARMEDAVLHGCIPVIIQDGILLPFEPFLEYNDFAVRISEADIPHMVDILQAMPESRVQQLWLGVQRIRPRWQYHSVVRLEGERQRWRLGEEEEWAAAVKSVDATIVKRGRGGKGPGVGGDGLPQLPLDDAIDTLLQVLLFKLFNDPWRQEARGRGNV